jgi:hypothetical protein
MARLFLQLGGLLFFNKRHKSIRRGIIFLLTNFLLFAGIVFTVEIILIFLGVGNIFVPVTSAVWDFLTKLVY